MKEIKGKSADELKELLVEKREALRMFRFGTAEGNNKNVKLGRSLRSDIARIWTEINAQRIKSS